jgi:hypothetical protein
MTRIRGVWLAGPAVMVALAACSGGGIDGPTVYEHVDGTLIIIAGSSEGGSDARLTGKLAVLDGDCLGIEADGTQFLVAWPSGVTVEEDELVIELDSERLRVGDDVDVTGGAVSAPFGGAVPDIPTSCAAEEIFVVNG